MFEDSFKNLRTAKSLGMTTVMVTGETAAEENVTRCLQRLNLKHACCIYRPCHQQKYQSFPLHAKGIVSPIHAQCTSSEIHAILDGVLIYNPSSLTLRHLLVPMVSFSELYKSENNRNLYQDTLSVVFLFSAYTPSPKMEHTQSANMLIVPLWIRTTSSSGHTQFQARDFTNLLV